MRDKKRNLVKRLAIMSLVLGIAFPAGHNVQALQKADLELEGYQEITALVKGQELQIEGQILSQEEITKIAVYILDENGKTVSKKIILPDMNYYELAQLNEVMEFELLEEGSYTLKLCARDSFGIAKTLLKQPFTVEKAPGVTVDQWLDDCKDALQYYVDEKFTYGVASPSYIATETTNKKTNCAAYVSWCLYRNGFVDDVQATNQIAQGAAAYVYGLGWEMNTDVNDIQPGDVVYYRQGNVTKAYQASAIQWFKKNGPSAAGSGMHVDICYDPANRKFLSAGSSTYIRTGKIATYGESYLKAHFVCSFRFPKQD